MKKYFAFLFLLFFSISVFSQNDYYNKNSFKYDDFVYSNDYYSVQLHKKGFDLSLPFIELNSSEQLILTFDDLSMKQSTYNYSFILCNSNWEPSDLMSMEYVDGNNEDYFGPNNQSYSTRTSYNHYELIFPKDFMKITKSGNYLLKVYKNGDPNDVIITKRFYVFDKKVAINANVVLPVTSKYRLTNHEINLEIDLGNYSMPNVYENLSVYIQQNGRTDNVKYFNHPKSISGNILKFNFQGDILFDAGNEFRNFDTRSLQTYSNRIANIETDSSGYHVLLMPDGSRANFNYLKYRDLNGKFAVISYDNTHVSSQIEADYAYVTFVLPMKQPRIDGSIFLMGELTNWKFNESNRLTYNAEIGAYEITLLLKQGYYDYQYMFIPDNSKLGSISTFEGSFSETENDYTIFVYYREQGDYYDKLIGIETIGSKF